MPAATFIAHNEISFITLLTEPAFVAFFSVGIVAFLAESFTILVPIAIGYTLDWSKLLIAMFALNTIVAEPGVVWHFADLWSETVYVN